ncbi:MAG: phosphatidate cytidylyltransferase [Deltaproteobacteria bacterium]|nr:phosphatidate cytidylyltransferase [Deltaproteobacteria bacterium]
MALSNLTVRVGVALALLPGVIALLWLGGPYFHALIIVAVAMSAHEYLCITGFRAHAPSHAFGLLVIVGVAVATTAAPLFWLGPVIVGATLSVFLWHLFVPGDIPSTAARAGLMSLGVVYTGILPTFLVHLRALPDGFGWVFMVFAVVWLSDTGAFFTGRAIGRHKLYLRVSPGKTWEGAFGGIASSILGTFLTRWLFLPALTPLDCLLIAIPGGALGQAGDLCESLLKRAYGVKDSGTSIPGHGGMLDRIDAVIFAAPYVYLMSRVLQ